MSNKHRREVTIEILVGLFMFSVLIALGIFTIVLSRNNLFQDTYQYEFVFTEVGGLREGDNVYLRGMNVGRVKQTLLEDHRVHVYATLDVPIQLRLGYKVEVVDASMLGGKNLKIYEGPENEKVLGENVTVFGSPPIDIISEVAETVNGLKNIISAVERGEGTFGKLLYDDEVYNSLASASEDFSKMIASVEQGEGTIGKLLKDDTVYEDASAMMVNLRTISDRLEQGEGTLGKLMTEDSQIFDDLEAALVAVRGISESINAGEGTLGKLVRDAKLYDETSLLVEDVRAAVDDLREASPITSFGSVLFGAF